MRARSYAVAGTDRSTSGNGLKLGAIAGAIILYIFCNFPATAAATYYADEDNRGSNIAIKCGEPPSSSGGGSGSGGSDPGDASTKDRQMYGACGVKPTPHYKTPLMAPFTSLNPNAYVYLKNKSGSNNGGGGQAGGKEDRVWQDAAYGRGTPGDAPTSKRVVGDDDPVNNNQDVSSQYDEKGAKPRLNAARPMVEVQQEPKTAEEKACVNRVKWDNAVNQTIMESTRYPAQREDQRLVAWEDESKPGEKLSMKNHCQSLRMTYEADEEYKAGDYLYTAYQKTVRDPNYRMRGKSNSALNTEQGKNVFALLVPDAYAAAAAGQFDEPGVNGLQKYKNQYPDRQDMKNLRINQYAPVAYERINDPTHPWTPRWDYKNNERDEFSPKGAEYSKYPKDNVRAAATATNVVKVDILEFRRPPYEKGINKRIGEDQKCWRNQTKACCTRDGCKPVPCWKCFGLSGKTDTPPCSTRHDQEDLKVLKVYQELVPGGKLPCGTSAATLSAELRKPYRMVNQLKIRRAQKGHPKDRLPNGAPEGYSHTEYFANRMPYPKEWDTGRSIQDSPSTGQNPMDFAGQFSTLVGVGREKYAPGSNSGTSSAFYLPEEKGPVSLLAELFGISSANAQSSGGSGNSDKPTNEKEDERCMMGGWGKDASCGGMSFKKPDPMTSWTELKAYQARTTSDYSISCIGRYEKLFAPGSAENKVLMRAGGIYEREVCSKKGSDGTYTTCGSGSGGSSSGSSGGGSGGGGNSKEFRENRQQTWPLAYRGRMCTKKEFDEDEKKDCKERTCFPFFGAQDGKCPELKKGLDEAKPGDIIMMFAGGAKEEDSSSGSGSSSSGGSGGNDGSKKPLMPTLAYVKSAHNQASTKDTNKPCSSDKNCNLIVETANDGQFPDACGNSFNWGANLSRVLYKKDNMPESYKQALKDVQQKNDVQNPVTDCSNPHFGACEFDDWDSVKVYRPSDDVRDKENGS